MNGWMTAPAGIRLDVTSSPLQHDKFLKIRKCFILFILFFVCLGRHGRKKGQQQNVFSEVLPLM